MISTPLYKILSQMTHTVKLDTNEYIRVYLKYVLYLLKHIKYL